jgi:hypothetical protein
MNTLMIFPFFALWDGETSRDFYFGHKAFFNNQQDLFQKKSSNAHYMTRFFRDISEKGISYFVTNPTTSAIMHRRICVEMLTTLKLF